MLFKQYDGNSVDTQAKTAVVFFNNINNSKMSSKKQTKKY